MDTSSLCTTRLLDQNFGLCITPEDILLPYFNSHGTNYFRPWKICPENGCKDFGSTIENEKDKFKITLDVQHFQPKEINVKVSGTDVIIEGKHEEREDNHGFISRQFRRQYSLPKDCLPETVTSTLSSDGVLIINASKAVKETKDAERTIPIKMCDPCPKKVETKCNKDAVKESKKNEITSKTKEVLDKKDSQIMLKEEHCRLLRPELLKEAASGKEKLLSETKKETEELLKLMSLGSSTQHTSGTGKLEDTKGQCKKSVAELSEKMSETNMSSSTEMTSIKGGKMSEIFESTEATSSVSSSTISSSSMTSSSMKATSAILSDLVISAKLNDAAETQ